MHMDRNCSLLCIWIDAKWARKISNFQALIHRKWKSLIGNVFKFMLLKIKGRILLILIITMHPCQAVTHCDAIHMFSSSWSYTWELPCFSLWCIFLQRKAISMMYASAEDGGQAATWRWCSFAFQSRVQWCLSMQGRRRRPISGSFHPRQHSPNDIKDAPHLFSRVENITIQLCLCSITQIIDKISLGAQHFANFFLRVLCQMDWSLFYM